MGYKGDKGERQKTFQLNNNFVINYSKTIYIQVDHK